MSLVEIRTSTTNLFHHGRCQNFHKETSVMNLMKLVSSLPSVIYVSLWWNSKFHHRNASIDNEIVFIVELIPFYDERNKITVNSMSAFTINSMSLCKFTYAYNCHACMSFIVFLKYLRMSRQYALVHSQETSCRLVDVHWRCWVLMMAEPIFPPHILSLLLLPTTIILHFFCSFYPKWLTRHYLGSYLCCSKVQSGMVVLLLWCKG